MLKIPHINSTVSYFGLANFPYNGKMVYLADWLPIFINNSKSTSSNIKDFSNNLRNELNKIIKKDILLKHPSGFHLSGYYDGKPDFWYFSNIGKLDGFSYSDLKDSYTEPSSHFLDRDYAKFKDLQGRFNQYYRNGDFRVHAIISIDFDSFMSKIFSYPDVNQINDEQDYAKYIKFKFSFITYCYKIWFKNKLIGTPIDMFLLRNNKEIENIR